MEVEIGGQRSEARGQISETRDQKSEVRNQRSEVRDQMASGIYLYRIEVIGEGKIPRVQ